MLLLFRTNVQVVFWHWANGEIDGNWKWLCPGWVSTPLVIFWVFFSGSNWSGSSEFGHRPSIFFSRDRELCPLSLETKFGRIRHLWSHVILVWRGQPKNTPPPKKIPRPPYKVRVSPCFKTSQKWPKTEEVATIFSYNLEHRVVALSFALMHRVVAWVVLTLFLSGHAPAPGAACMRGGAGGYSLIVKLTNNMGTAAAHGAAVTVISSMFSEFSRRDLADDPADLVTSPDYIIKIFGFFGCLLLVVVCFLFWSSFCKPSNSSFKQSTENNYASGPIGMFLGNMCGVMTHVDNVGRVV